MERSAPQRFGKHNRLVNAAAFAHVFEKATRSRDKWFSVLCRENDDGPARLGLAISKKHCRKATARNKIKRAVRESFRQHKAALSGLDIVVINKPAAADAESGQLSDSLENHWRKCQRMTGNAGPQV